jgi:lysozyme family protein
MTDIRHNEIFIEAFGYVLKNEGGFVNHPNDSGGATNYGISLRFLKSLTEAKLKQYGIFDHGELLTPRVVEDLTPEQAQLIYKGEFWDHARFEEIDDPWLRIYIFDGCVQHGMSQGIKIAQRALWAVNHQYYFIIDDGILGDKTLELLNEDIANTPTIYSCMSERAGYMRLLAAINPKNEQFLEGWLKRAYRI